MHDNYSSFDRLGLPVLVVSGDRRIVFANRRFRALSPSFARGIEGDWLSTVHEDDRQRVASAWALSVDQHISFSCECRLAHPDLWTHVHAEPPEPGGPGRWMLGFSEVSQYKLVEQELMFREGQLERIFSSPHAAIACLDRHFNFIRVNAAYAAADKREVEFFPGRNHFDLYPNDENRAIFQQVLDSGEPYQVWARPFEYAANPERGRTWWDWSLWPLQDEVNGERQLLLVLVEVTRRVMAEQELMIYRFALDTALDAFSMADLDGRIIYANRAFLDMLGYADQSEVLGRIGTSLMSDQEEGRRVLATLHEQGSWVGEMLARRIDGSEVPVRVAAHLNFGQDGQPVGVMASFVDISAQKAIENELLRKEQVLAEAQAIASMGSWDWNIVTGELAWSEEIYRIFGLQPNQFPATYEAFLNTIHPEDRQRVTDAVAASVASAEVPYDIDHRIVRPDGEERIVHEKGMVYRDEAGTPVHMIGTVHDVTESRQVQEILTRFKTTLDMTLDCVFMFDPDTLRFFYVNQGAMDQVGYSHDELMAMHPYDIKPDFNEASFRALVEPMTRGEMQVRYFETTHRGRDGRDIPVEIFLQYIRPRGASPRFVAIVRDISERRRSEAELARYREHLEDLVQERTLELEAAHERLVRQERLATLGQLTATVSHELRNPLGAIKSSLYVLEKILSGVDDDRVQEIMRRLDRSVSRCDHIIDELLDFTRIIELNRETQAVGPWLQSVLEEMGLPEEVRVELDLPEDELLLGFDGSRLRRAVINVVENACQAMLMDGSASHYTPGAALSVSVASGPGRVDLVFRDTGGGIPEDVLERIFEPLFSTKGFGVGLGMPAVKQIMSQHQGGVEVRNLPGGGGAEVRLWLPKKAVPIPLESATVSGGGDNFVN